MRGPTTPAITGAHPGAFRGLVARRPVLTLCVVVIGLSVSLQMALVLTGRDIFPGKAAELLILPGTAVLLTAWLEGRAGVGRLLAGLIRWRIGMPRWLLILVAMPVLTVGVAAAAGTLVAPAKGWGDIALWYVIILGFSALTANLWEELAWSGFVQVRLMSRHGLLVGSLLTAVPFFLIHLPLAWENAGWAGTSSHDVLVTWAWLLVALPFFRYLAGMLLVDTEGSVLAVGILHGSFNAAGAMAVLAGGWEYVPAVVLLTLLVAGVRALRRRRLGVVTDLMISRGTGPG
ncbi:MAG: CPBP family intramembrane glutamic endopeptidase [Friedmanniella sp.]